MIYKCSPAYSFSRANKNNNNYFLYKGMLTTPNIGKYSNTILHKPLGGFSFHREEKFKSLYLETPGPGQYEINLSLMGQTPRYSLNNTFSGPFFDKNTKKTLKLNKSQYFLNNKNNLRNNIRSDLEFILSDKKPKEQIKKKTKKNLNYNNNRKNIKKRMIIQTHSSCCDIEKIDGKLYLINKEEANITLLLCHSLNSENISIYTFNIAQVNLLKKKIKSEFPSVNITLLNDNCTNIKFSNYIIINYIDSPISVKSSQKYGKVDSKSYSANYYTKEFSDLILKNYTGKVLYLICNNNYIKSKKKDITFTKVYKEIQVPSISRKIVSNEYNICFILDNTGSMENWINSLKNICVQLFEEVVNKFKKYYFSFACVLYADKASFPTDENFKIDFTENSLEFKTELEKIQLQNGGDAAEDWVSGFQIALEELMWGNGTKLIFHFADAPHHGRIFNIDRVDDDLLDIEDDIQGKKLIQLINRCSKRNIKITGISINQVSSFNVFKEEYEKVDGPKYEIININSFESTNTDNNIDKKIFHIIEKCINENSSKNLLK